MDAGPDGKQHFGWNPESESWLKEGVQKKVMKIWQKG